MPPFRAVAQLLGMPSGKYPVAVLCLGPVDHYYAKPMLGQEKRTRRAPLEAMIMVEG